MKHQTPPKKNEQLSIIEARTFLGRFRGLIARDLKENQGLLFRNANSLHTCFMRYSLDIVFLNEDFKVTKILRNLKPWKIAIDVKSRHFLEIPSKQAYNIAVGDIIPVELQTKAYL